MISLDQQTAAPRPPAAGPEPVGDELLYTRYCAAPRPAHPVGEPRLIHSLLVAAWLGRLIDPLPHRSARPKPGSA